MSSWARARDLGDLEGVASSHVPLRSLLVCSVARESRTAFDSPTTYRLAAGKQAHFPDRRVKTSNTSPATMAFSTSSQRQCTYRTNQPLEHRPWPARRTAPTTLKVVHVVMRRFIDIRRLALVIRELLVLSDSVAAWRPLQNRSADLQHRRPSLRSTFAHLVVSGRRVSSNTRRRRPAFPSLVLDHLLYYSCSSSGRSARSTGGRPSCFVAARRRLAECVFIARRGGGRSRSGSAFAVTLNESKPVRQLAPCALARRGERFGKQSWAC